MAQPGKRDPNIGLCLLSPRKNVWRGKTSKTVTNMTSWSLQFSWSSSGGAPQGATSLIHFSSAPDPFFKASKAPFLTLRVATPTGAPRQAPLDKTSTFGST